MIEIEEFREVVGFEGLYEVSNYGRVRRNGRILKPWKNRKGYLHVDLSKNGIRRKALIHRLVAQSFIPNPNNYPEINHKDENKTNNAVDNLEWCTREYNNNYSKAKPVLQFDKEGNFIREWPSGVKVEEELGIHQQSISWCCLGKRYKSAGGYLWKYKN